MVSGRHQIRRNPGTAVQDGVLSPRRAIIRADNAIPSLLVSLLVHILVLMFRQGDVVGLEGWIVISLGMILWTLALTPIVAVVRGDLYWGDPLSFLALLFFGMSCLAGVVYWIAPDVIETKLILYRTAALSDLTYDFAEAQLLTITFWAIILAANPVASGPRLGGRGGVSSESSSEAAQCSRQRVSPLWLAGLGFLVLAVYAWFGLYGSVNGYIQRLLRVAYRGLEFGQGRYALLYSVASFGSLFLIPALGGTSRKRCCSRLRTGFSLGLLLGLVAGAFPLGDRIASFMLIFVGCTMIDRYVARIGRKGIAIGLAVVVLLTGARRLYPPDYEFISIWGLRGLDVHTRLMDWRILLHVDRMTPTVLCISRIREGHPFVYGETLVSSLDTIYRGIKHFVFRSPLSSPRLWNMQAYTAYWRYGVPSGELVLSQCPPGMVGELFFNGGYVALVVGSYFMAQALRRLRATFYRAASPGQMLLTGLISVLYMYAVVTEFSVFITHVAYVFVPVAVLWYLALALTGVGRTARYRK